jgi:hypothetical protein
LNEGLEANKLLPGLERGYLQVGKVIMGTLVRAFGRLGGVLSLILLVIALLRQLIALVGFLLALIKFAIVVIFAVLVVMIVLAILRDRAHRRRETEDL